MKYERDGDARRLGVMGKMSLFLAVKEGRNKKKKRSLIRYLYSIHINKVYHNINI